MLNLKNSFKSYEPFADFDVGDLDKIAEAGAKAGLKLKVHSEQLSRLGSLGAAIKHGAVTADHLDCVEEGDMAALAASKTVACLVPGSNYFLGKPYPPGRRLLDSGAAMALAMCAVTTSIGGGDGSWSVRGKAPRKRSPSQRKM